MKHKFGYILLVMALSLAAAAAYFSVWGLSQLFAGASTAVIIMASLLEVGKIVTTTALHKYWTKFSKTLKIYLSVSVITLMMITSVGIYGFLSNAYQQTANKLEIHEGELGVLTMKKESFQKTVDDNEKIIATKNKRIEQLTNLRINQENRIDSAKFARAKDKARSDIEKSSQEIQKLTNDIDVLNTKNGVMMDSVNAYNIKTLTLNSSSSISGEIGPLKYISSLTNTPMDKVVNYLILLLIFVFDPLAVALILAANRVLDIQTEEKKEEDDVKKNTNNLDHDNVVEEIVENIVENNDIVENVENNPDNVVEDQTAENQVTRKIGLTDIKEIKEDINRGYSVPIPKPRASNTIQRVGTNKIVKNGDNDVFFFKKK